MLLGIVSDTHGRVEMMKKALAIFDEVGVEEFIHCGDVGEEVLEEFVGRRCAFVWGNTDPVDGSLLVFVQTLGLATPRNIPLVLQRDGKSIAVCHGHEPPFAGTIECGEYDYVFHGHTHQARDERIGRTRVINPGALFRCSPPTVAVLDPANDELQFIEVK